MVETWGTINQENGNLIIPGFDQFALQNIMPLCFQIPLKPNFNLNDGVTYVVCFYFVCIYFDFIYSQTLR